MCEKIFQCVRKKKVCEKKKGVWEKKSCVRKKKLCEKKKVVWKKNVCVKKYLVCEKLNAGVWNTCSPKDIYFSRKFLGRKRDKWQGCIPLKFIPIPIYPGIGIRDASYPFLSHPLPMSALECAFYLTSAAFSTFVANDRG